WASTIVLDPFNADRAFVTSGNGLFMTQNLSAATSSWIFQVKGLDETVPLDLVNPPYGAPLISVIGDYDGFRHNNLDVSPTLGRHNPSIGSTSTLDFAEKNPGVVVRAGATAYYSADNAKTWKLLPVPVTGAKDGSMAVSSDGSTIAWSPNAQTVYITTNKTTWTKSTGAPTGQRIIADRVNAQKFYVISSQNLYTSTDGGKTFAIGATNALLTQVKKYRATPGYEGDIWIPNGSMGLFRSIWSNSVTSIKKMTSVSACEAVGFGKAASGQTFPAIYIWGTVNGVEGIFRSDNEGIGWVRINDAAHEFGGTGNANEVLGDPRIYGRVYMSTAGRGIVYGDLVDGPDANVVIDSEYFPPVTIFTNLKTDPLFEIQSDLGQQSIRITSKEKGSYEIFSITGSLLEKGNYETQKSVAKGFRSGIYFVRFTSEAGKVESKKFMINR
ncbi:MAG TPA: T9SS type A sorting domain-containing protein, partial [Prolixibacteraceae bacterium]